MGNKRLLIVEDDPMTQQVLRKVFENAGFQTIIVGDAPDALHVIQQQGLPHLAIIDLKLPTSHGYTLSEKIKRLGDVPIVILTADNSDDVRIHGIENYADDYIVKPFHNREVLARIQNILNEITDFSYAEAPVIEIDSNLSIDFSHSRVILDGEEKNLTPKEAKLLSVLMRSKGHYINTEILISRVWLNSPTTEDVLRPHMHRLRDKIQPKDERQYIHTERGLGYAFIPPDEFLNEKKAESRVNGRLQAVSL